MVQSNQVIEHGVSQRRLKLGLVGLGVGTSMALPEILSLQNRYEIVAGADINPRVVEAFRSQFPEARGYDSIEKLVADPDIEVVWIGTPNQFHAAHCMVAVEHGKNVVVVKPMTTRMEEAALLVEAEEKYGVKVVAGLSAALSPVFRAMRRVVLSGQIGQLRAMHSVAHTDWLTMPRNPDEVDPSIGGGLIYRQGPNQMDTVRVIGGAIRSVRAFVGQWMPERPCPGYYTALIQFESGVSCTLVYNGYGYFLTSELVPWGTTTGLFGMYNPEQRGEVRRALRKGGMDEADLKDMQRIGGNQVKGTVEQSNAKRAWIPHHLGIFVVNCERGDVRQSAHGLYVYSDDGLEDIPVEGANSLGGAELDELYDAIVHGAPIYHDARWGMATLEAVLAIMDSARLDREVRLSHQVSLPDTYF
jgi:phthalate 4,5-cis-dihydrodiol dehydrogenase